MPYIIPGWNKRSLLMFIFGSGNPIVLPTARRAWHQKLKATRHDNSLNCQWGVKEAMFPCIADGGKATSYLLRKTPSYLLRKTPKYLFCKTLSYLLHNRWRQWPSDPSSSSAAAAAASSSSSSSSVKCPTSSFSRLWHFKCMMGYFGVSIIHRTLTQSTRSLTCDVVCLHSWNYIHTGDLGL